MLQSGRDWEALIMNIAGYLGKVSDRWIAFYHNFNMTIIVTILIGGWSVDE